jgi:hypothetical protein
LSPSWLLILLCWAGLLDLLLPLLLSFCLLL